MTSRSAPASWKRLKSTFGGLVAGEGRTAEDSFGIRQPHEGQEAQVVMDGGVELLAKPLGRLTGAERGGHGQIDDVLTGPVDVDLHGGF